MSSELTLRYFDARGRAQFLRYYLRVRNVEFNDERVPVEADFSSWSRIRDDESLTGPFHKLPVLETGELLVAETLVIAEFLHRQFGDADALDKQTELQHRQLISSLYSEATLSIGMLLWAEMIFPGLDFQAYAKRTLDRLRDYMQCVEHTLNEWRWREEMDRRPIMLADCLLWESIDWCRTVFGPHFGMDALRSLAAIHARYAVGTAFSELLADSPCSITARGHAEADVIERIQTLIGD